MAAKRQEEKKRVEDKEEGSSSRGRKEDLRDPDMLGSKRVPKSSNDVTGECWTGPAGHLWKVPSESSALPMFYSFKVS